jgi:hypothetical protein
MFLLNLFSCDVYLLLHIQSQNLQFPLLPSISRVYPRVLFLSDMYYLLHIEAKSAISFVACPHLKSCALVMFMSTMFNLLHIEAESAISIVAHPHLKSCALVLFLSDMFTCCTFKLHLHCHLMPSPKLCTWHNCSRLIMPHIIIKSISWPCNLESKFKLNNTRCHSFPPVALPPSPSVSPFFLLYNKAFNLGKSVCWSKVSSTEEEEDDEKEVHSEIARIRMRSNAMISKTYVKLMQVMNSIGKTYAGISDADTKKGFLSSLVDAKSFFLHSFDGDTV